MRASLRRLKKRNFIRIVGLKIEGLFGRFNYSIDLKNMRDGVTILTAPNGYGKSTIINIIKNFSSGDHHYFIRENYRVIVFYFSDGRSLEIRKHGGGQESPVVMMASGRYQSKIKDPFEEDRIAVFERLFSFLTRIGPGAWRNDHTGEILTKMDIVDRYASHPVIRKSQKRDEWVDDIVRSLKVEYISTNRLKADPEYRPGMQYSDRLMVSHVADTIREKISDAIRAQFEFGRELETSFPARLIESLNRNRYPSGDEIRSMVEQIQAYERKYVSLGLLPAMSTTAQLEFMDVEASSALTVLKTYLDDIQQKFSILEDFSGKLRVFKDSVNSLFSFKMIETSVDDGIRVKVSDGEESYVPLQALSSGEQHLLVLIGRLVFQVDSNSLVLIDEPEISFHPEWQERFLDILSNIQDVNPFSALISTHSPILIGERWDQVVELAEQVREA